MELKQPTKPKSYPPDLGVAGRALYEAASNYLDQNIGVFLADPTSGNGLDGTDEYAPIQGKEDLLDMCLRNQNASLAVVVVIDGAKIPPSGN